MTSYLLIFLLMLTQNIVAQFSDNRTLLLFYSGDRIALQQQLDTLKKYDTEVKERDLIVKVVSKTDDLYKQHKITTAPLTVILIGKDGTEKLRSNKVVEPKQLFAIIDAMPMRRNEMRRKNP